MVSVSCQCHGTDCDSSWCQCVLGQSDLAIAFKIQIQTWIQRDRDTNTNTEQILCKSSVCWWEYTQSLIEIGAFRLPSEKKSKLRLFSMTYFTIWDSMTGTKFYKLRLLAVVIKGSVAFHILQHFTANLLWFICKICWKLNLTTWKPLISQKWQQNSVN